MIENTRMCSWTRLSLAAAALAVGLFVLPASARAASILGATYHDENLDGSIDSARISLSENITVCGYRPDSWSVVSGGDFNLQITGLSCLGNVITLKVSGDALETGSATNPSVAYKNMGDIMLQSGLWESVSNISLTDKAQPMIVSTVPANGGTVYSLTADVVVNFTEAVNPATLVIVDSKISAGNYTTVFANAYKKATLSHTQAWPENTTVNFQVLAARDLAGNELDGAVVPNPWNFQIPAVSGSSARAMGLIQINGGEDKTTSRIVTVDVAYLNATEIILSEKSDFSGASFETIAAHVPFVLSEGAGLKTIYARVKGNTGTSETIFDTITYQPPVPEAPVVSETPVSDLGIKLSTLIKGSASTVYFYAKNGTRYVVPDMKTLESWYGSNPQVTVVSDSLLSQITFAGIVTFRPGSLIKIATDPKVYAVGKGGELHWVQSESLAAAIFGADWAMQVRDVADVYFTNYTMGTAIASPLDFDPIAVKNAVSTIDADKSL